MRMNKFRSEGNPNADAWIRSNEAWDDAVSKVVSLTSGSKPKQGMIKPLHLSERNRNPPMHFSGSNTSSDVADLLNLQHGKNDQSSECPPDQTTSQSKSLYRAFRVLFVLYIGKLPIQIGIETIQMDLLIFISRMRGNGRALDTQTPDHKSSEARLRCSTKETKQTESITHFTGTKISSPPIEVA